MIKGTNHDIHELQQPQTYQLSELASKLTCYSNALHTRVLTNLAK